MGFKETKSEIIKEGRRLLKPFKPVTCMSMRVHWDEQQGIDLDDRCENCNQTSRDHIKDYENRKAHQEALQKFAVENLPTILNLLERS